MGRDEPPVNYYTDSRLSVSIDMDDAVDGIYANKLDISIVGMKNSFESDLDKLLNERKNVLSDTGATIIADVTTELVKNFVPFLDNVMTFITKLNGYCASEDWKSVFLRTIEQAKRADVESHIKRVRAHLSAIKLDFQELMKRKLSDQSTIELNPTLADTVKRDLRKYLHEYALEDSDYRNYPLVTIGPLISLGTMISSLGTVYPTIFSDLACLLHLTLREYRSLSVHERLNKIAFYRKHRNMLHKDVNARNVLMKNIEHEPFRSIGYNKPNANVIKCQSDSNHYEELFPEFDARDAVYNLLKDEMGGQDVYFASNPTRAYDMDCIVSYMHYIRYRVERQFNGLINAVAELCPKHIEPSPKTATGTLENDDRNLESRMMFSNKKKWLC